MADEREGYVRAVINFGSELIYAQVPDPTIDHQQHMVSIIVGPEGMDVYVDGVPIDPDTGTNPTDDAITAADDLVEWWMKSGWKLSTNTKKISVMVEAYLHAREKLRSQQESQTKIATPQAPVELPRFIPAVESKPGWNDFIVKMQKKYSRGQLVPCSCGETLPTFDDLKIHWDQGHFDNIPETENTPSHAFMPQREGPVTSDA